MFTGASRHEEIRLWDLRARSVVYELSTGNTAVVSLSWDAGRNVLYAATESRYMDRRGNNYGYRRARLPADYVPEVGDDDEIKCWPKNAYHGEDYFGYLFDAGEHKICRHWFTLTRLYANGHLVRYAFRESPDTSILPPFGQAMSNLAIIL